MSGLRPRLTHIARTEHDESWIRGAKSVVLEPQTPHDAGPHILDDDVGTVAQLARDLDAFLRLQIGSHAVFRIVEIAEAGRAIDSDFAVFEGRILQAESVRTLEGFDVHDLRAEVRQVLPDRGP